MFKQLRIIKYFPVLFIALLGINIKSMGQIVAPSASYADTTSYSHSPQDKIYIFNNLQTGQTVSGSLEVNALPSTVPCDFRWLKFDSGSYSFSIPLKYDTASYSSVIKNLSSGGYKVEITNAQGLDTSFIAWVYNNRIDLTITNKNALGKIKLGSFTCEYVDIRYSIADSSFKYYEGKTPIVFLHDLTLSLVSTPQSTVPIPSTLRNYVRIWYPPAVDTHYRLELKDEFGNTKSDEVLYESIRPSARFKVKIMDSKGVTQETGVLQGVDRGSDSKLEGSGKILAEFSNNSVNAIQFDWDYGDSLNTQDPRTEATQDSLLGTSHTFYFPADYYVKMIAHSEEGCVDSVKSPAITVKEAELEFPNVITPGVKDGINDFFKPVFETIRSFKLSIFDRWGKKVYEYRHDINDKDWKGWDGTVMGKGERYVSSGIYFYVVDAEGYGDIKPPTSGGGQKKGFLYVF